MDGEKINELESISSFFNNTYSKIYEDLLNKELPNQVALLKRFIDKNKDYKILDMCCGSGRHLLELLKLNYQVDGVDYSSEYIKSIERVVVDKRYKTSLYCEDIRYFKKNSHNYDCVYCLESSLGYHDDIDNLAIFKVVSKTLKKDGKFILHLINKEYLLKNITRKMWFGNQSNGYVLEERNFNLETGILKLDQKRIEDGHETVCSINLRLYSLVEIKVLLGQAGLKVKELYGDFNMNKYTINSPYLIIIASQK